jgi:hypothetical protein
LRLVLLLLWRLQLVLLIGSSAATFMVCWFGLGVIVLLPVVLPMPKDRKAPDAALHPADELLRS